MSRITQAVASLIWFSALSALGQGSLAPSVGPAPTMKTLAQLDPRTPISSEAFVISQPGSYYLTTNLTTTGSVAGQCNGNPLSGCNVSDASFQGIYLEGASGGQCEGNSISCCVLRNNTDYGIFLSYANGNRIEDNHVTETLGGTPEGVHTENSSGNFLARNSCNGQGFHYGIDPNDAYGPVVTNTGSLNTSGAAAHPWANFSR